MAADELGIDWDETASLDSVVGEYHIRRDPLWLVLITAIQGHEGAPEDLLITTDNGATYTGDSIRALAAHPDRKGRPQQSVHNYRNS